MRLVSLLLAWLLSVGLLSACSAGGPYCEAIEKNAAVFNTFDKRTSANFKANALASAEVAKVAPAKIADDWQAIAKATAKVVSALNKSGIKLEDLDDEAEVNALEQSDIDRLDKVFGEFNETKTHRENVVADADEACGVDLSKKK